MTTTTTSILDQIAALPYAEKLPLFGPEGIRTPHYGLFRTDNGQALETTCKRGYHPHTTDDVYAISEACLVGLDVDPAKAIVEVDFDNRKGHTVAIRPTDDYRREVCKNDSVWPQIIIRAGYGTAFSATAGIYRDACLNLSWIRKVEASTVVLRHTSGFRAKFDETVETFRRAIGTYDETIAAISTLEERTANIAEFLNETVRPPKNNSKRSRASYERRIEKIVERLHREREAVGKRPAKKRASVWELVNAVTGYVQHDKNRTGNPNATQRAFAGIDDPFAARAWDHAFAIAG